MTIKHRLILVLSALLLLALATGILGLYGMQKSNDGLKSVYENRTIAIDMVSTIDQLLQRSHLAIASALLDPTEPVIKAETALVESNIAQSITLLDAYKAMPLTAPDRQLAEQLGSARDKLVKEGLAPAVKGLRDLNLDGTSQLLKEKIVPMLRPVHADLQALRVRQVQGAKEEYEQASQRYGRIRGAMLITLVLAALATAAAAAGLIRTLYRQLGGEPGYSGEVARTIATGDLTQPILVREGDDRSLLLAMRTMQGTLAATVAAIRHTTGQVASGSSEIAVGNQDLADRTEAQALALTRTADSLQQLTSTVKRSVENAQQVSSVAAAARDVAVQGGEVVSRVVQTMTAINQSAAKIADIISVIDGIAFQTNILALNAAVEAARAGEQGRGFAVVASEVRNLAQRSAAAAKEIKILIGDSASDARRGTTLVDEAGRTMHDIVDAVKRVSALMVDITASSQEQARGIELANQAVIDMDHATRQNAGVVAAAALAAAELERHSATLAAEVAFFRIDAGTAAAVAQGQPLVLTLR